MKITFMGAGSTIFVKNVLGDCMMTEVLKEAEFALYDIDPQRLDDSRLVVEGLKKLLGADKATVTTFCGVENRKAALRGASFVINAIQVGGYEPCTVIDFEIPKKYGLRQTIGDTLGVGGIFRAMRTIPVMADFARDMEEVCPDAWLLNYTNPMAMLTGYMQRYTGVKTIGLCHSVQVLIPAILNRVQLSEHINTCRYTFGGINHMCWLLSIHDKDGNDLYPEIRRRTLARNTSGEKHDDMVRFDYTNKLGYYCSESSEHNAEYNCFYIKQGRDDLIEKFNIPLDEYPRRCVKQIEQWAQQRADLLAGKGLEHVRSREYASRILEAMITDVPYMIGGNVINNGLISNLPAEACVEVPCMVNRAGVNPCQVGALPLQLAAMNASNIYPQLLTIEAAHTGRKDTLYQAVMMDPVAGAQLCPDEIVAMCDDLLEAHAKAGFPVPVK
ncbi:MAG: alpha-glucosidase/alpha-galactosidase [Oscillospiraceae bacterium]|nr:alpha-glucosidase/alpha-galactosidase [Oscillospiraceae bacterium]